MLSEIDITKLANILATKDDVKNIDFRLDQVEETTSVLTTSVDSLAKKVDTLATEVLAIKMYIKLI